MSNVRGLFNTQCSLKGITHSLTVDNTEGGFRASITFCDRYTWAENVKKKAAIAQAFGLALDLLRCEFGLSERQNCPRLEELVSELDLGSLPSVINKGHLLELGEREIVLFKILFQSIESGVFRDYSEFQKVIRRYGYKAHQDGSGGIHIRKIDGA
uniref:Uncharacterized protein n=1 Tax=viral metagenome TaxID=1070528 RepID=A0A2V0RGZ0_9ZZZZ